MGNALGVGSLVYWTSLAMTHGMKTYIAKDLSQDNLYKIGCSRNPIDRVKSLGTGSRCSLVHESQNGWWGLDAEAFLHNLLRDRRTRHLGSGYTEWFKLSDFEVNLSANILETHIEKIKIDFEHEDLKRRYNNLFSDYKIAIQNYNKLLQLLDLESRRENVFRLSVVALAGRTKKINTKYIRSWIKRIIYKLNKINKDHEL
jgi:hypothetical protein